MSALTQERIFEFLVFYEVLIYEKLINDLITY